MSAQNKKMLLLIYELLDDDGKLRLIGDILRERKRLGLEILEPLKQYEWLMEESA